MASGHEMRAGHAEREAVAAELREHYASGRLTLDELNERLEATFAAKTRGDLDELMRDLPAGHSAQAGGPSEAPSGWGGMGGPGGIGGPGGWGGPGGGGPGDWSGQSDWGRQSDWGPRTGRGAGQAIAAVIPGLFLIAALLIVGGLAVFGVGATRPFGIVLIFAALAFLRRLLSRRRFGRACGPRRRW
jgi:hypothetical protein